MPELIDKRKTQNEIALIAKYLAKSDAQKAIIGRILFMIDHMPTIEPEVRHGRWIDVPYANTRVAKCSLCGFWQRTNGDDKTGKHLIHNAIYRYCAGCGARMDADHIDDVSKKVGGAENG